VLVDEGSSQLQSFGDVPRWELYRLLSDPVRVRLLALVSLEELAVGELAELLNEGQPKVSRHGAALRDAGLVLARKNGTSVLLKIEPRAELDAVVADAIATGRRLVTDDGTRARVDAVVRARDEKAREYFAKGGPKREPKGGASEAPAYLAGLAPLFAANALALDAGTGDGSLLEVLGPVFQHVVAVDRSAPQLRMAEARANELGLRNVSFVQAELDDADVERAVFAKNPRGADLVFVSRVLHHAPKPSRAVQKLGALLRKETASEQGGALVLLDYAPHEDLAMKEAQADLWLGFDAAELESFARDAGLLSPRVTRLPRPFRGDGPDAHLDWLSLFARRGR
jgi:DNA-binding transcriptional ArsR family regulator